MKLNNLKKLSTYSKTDVCIIGGGTIGMTLANLLSKFKVDHLILEKEKDPNVLFSHPKAHYISPKTVEVFKYLDVFKDHKKDLNYLNSINNWRHYRYCEYLIDANSYYGEIDHLDTNWEETMSKINKISNSYPVHIGQNDLNRRLFNHLQNSTYYFNKGYSDIKWSDTENSYFIKLKDDQNCNFEIESKIIVGCDGSHSQIRKRINADNNGIKNIQTFVNAHFISMELANKLKSINKQSMLHFIFNPKHVVVLISYDLNKGEFVLQIPYFENIESHSDYTKEKCLSIINSILSSDGVLKNVKFWKMKNVVADKWFENRMFIIGDAAHQFPPSGGYGLNQGVSDAFALSWRLKYILDAIKTNDLQLENALKNSFQKERIIHSKFVSQCAQLNYDKFLKSCQTLGLNINNCYSLEKIVKASIPSALQKSIFNTFMSAGITISNFLFKNKLTEHLKRKDNHIKLVFPYLDYGLDFFNAEKNKILDYEKFIDLENVEISPGKIIQNYEIKNSETRLRELLKNLQTEKDYPIFFVIMKNKKEGLLENINLFSDYKVLLSEVKFELIINNIEFSQHPQIQSENTQIFIQELQQFNIVVIRPDYIIQYIN